jgi:hypothetical protein
MSEKTTPIAKRAVQMAAFTFGGGVALAFAMAGSAHADTITVQDSTVVNGGVGVANSGGNVAVGNASQNAAGCGQAAVGFLANNSCDASNQSDGTASITTGSASATGNESQTSVQQAASNDDDGGAGLDVTVQDSHVVNAGVGLANSGGNVAVGNASRNLAGCGQLAVGFIANNSCDASNESDGHATIVTGDATAVGNMSKTNVSQQADGGDGNGLDVTVQHAGVANLGLGIANSGGNLALGNVSGNLALDLQGAFGVVANNTANASNKSNGSASIKTGNATGIGNSSDTEISQKATGDTNGLGLVIQSAPVLNAGLGIANSGLNAELGNGSLNAAIIAQVSFGLLSNNVANPSNWSDGFAFELTGNATGIGNQSHTAIKQES